MASIEEELGKAAFDGDIERIRRPGNSWSNARIRDSGSVGIGRLNRE